MDTEELDTVFRTNVYASLFLTRAAVPVLPPGGSIIFTTSGTVESHGPGAYVYGASKAAIAFMTRSLSAQLAPRGVRVNAVAPGLTYTPFLSAGGFTTEAISDGAGNSPLGRIEQPVELSPLYVDLADPRNTYVTGEIYAALGGRGM
jgi:NAD(P)-dependent dehydrogenase (short-subunit alcohol dehydrogenase family)